MNAVRFIRACCHGVRRLGTQRPLPDRTKENNNPVEAGRVFMVRDSAESFEVPNLIFHISRQIPFTYFTQQAFPGLRNSVDVFILVRSVAAVLEQIILIVSVLLSTSAVSWYAD